MAVVVKKPPEVEHWSTSDFTRYFMFKWSQFHKNTTYKFPKESWLMYGVHIKRFIGKHKLTNTAYRDFVDWVFELATSRHKQFLAFPAIVDNRMWILYQRIGHKDSPHVVKPITDVETEKLTNELCESEYLFPEDAL